jgi:hypothetical protein
VGTIEKDRHMRPIRFTPEEAEKIRNEYFFEKKPDGKNYSYTDLSKKHNTCISTIIDVVNRRRQYKPSPEVIASRLATASEAMRMFIGETPRLPRKHEETYATTMVKGEMLRIKKSPLCGSDGKNLFTVDTIRRTHDTPAIRSQNDRRALSPTVQVGGVLPDKGQQQETATPVQDDRPERQD